MQDPGAFRTMQAREFGDPKREVAVRALIRAIDKSMARAIHRLQAVALAPSLRTHINGRVVGLGIRSEEHIVAEIVPVSRGMEELIFVYLRRNYFIEAVSAIESSNVVDQRVENNHSFREIERLSRRNG